MQNFCFCFNALSCKVVIFVLKGETENESWRTTPPLTKFLFWNYNCCIQRHYYVEIKCQLDATEVFIADFIACSTCFGHHYAHHQELKSIILWLLRVVFCAVVFQVAGLVWS